MSEIFGSRSRGSSGPRPKTSSSRSAWIFSCSSKFRGTRWSAMISFTMPDTAWRAWLELTRDSFSRSSLEIRVRCISALYFSRFSSSTFYLPSGHDSCPQLRHLKRSSLPKWRQRAVDSSTTHGEGHAHRGLHVHRLSVEKVWLVAPGLNCIQRRLSQHGWSADSTEIFDRSRLGNGSLYHHCAGDSGFPGHLRINRSGFLNQQTAGDTRRDAHLRGSRDLHLRPVLPSEDVSRRSTATQAIQTGRCKARRGRGFLAGQHFKVTRNPRRRVQLMAHCYFRRRARAICTRCLWCRRCRGCRYSRSRLLRHARRCLLRSNHGLRRCRSGPHLIAHKAEDEH